MKKIIFLLTLVFASINFYSQEENTVFKSGEWLKFDMGYSGFLKAGTATLELKEVTLEGKEVLHAVGKGKTSGLISWFFKVKDTYESYFDATTVTPYLFKRKINEGGYKKHKPYYKKNKQRVLNTKHYKHKGYKHTLNKQKAKKFAKNKQYIANKKRQNYKTEKYAKSHYKKDKSQKYVAYKGNKKSKKHDYAKVKSNKSYANKSHKKSYNNSKHYEKKTKRHSQHKQNKVKRHSKNAHHQR